MKCLDTTYFIDLIRRPDKLKQITKKLDSEGIHATTTINVYESLFGAFAIKSDKSDKMVKKLFSAFNKLQILEFNYKDAVLASEIGGKLKLQGKIIGIDAIIAAISINNGCEAIVTRNKEHFDWINNIKNLKVEPYSIQ